LVARGSVSTYLEVDTLNATDTQSHSGLVRRVNADGRRVYEQQAKLAVVREAMAPGVSLAKVALRHGINANLLRKWVVKHGATATRVATTPALLPVVVAPSTKASTPKPAKPTARERTPIEIELPRGVVRFYGAIERSVLRELIEALSLR
jgi:transposase